MTEAILEKRIADLDELLGVIRSELQAAKDEADHHEAFLLQRELSRTMDRHRQLSAELHLMHHPKKRASYRPKKVRCPECGRVCTEGELEAHGAIPPLAATA